MFTSTTPRASPTLGSLSLPHVFRAQWNCHSPLPPLLSLGSLYPLRPFREQGPEARRLSTQSRQGRGALLGSRSPPPPRRPPALPLPPPPGTCSWC